MRVGVEGILIIPNRMKSECDKYMVYTRLAHASHLKTKDRALQNRTRRGQETSDFQNSLAENKLHRADKKGSH